MTTHKQAFSSRPTANNAAAQARSAERRQCPECGRKSAIVTEREHTGDELLIHRACRWCDFVETKRINLTGAANPGERRTDG